MLTLEDVAKLTAPFAANEHEFLKGFTYLTEQAVTTRLDSVDPSWEFQITNVEHKGEVVTVYGALTVCGVTRQSCGMDKPRNPNSEVEKGAVTDALKRCARLFGVGRYILDLPESVKDDRTLAKWLGDEPQSAPKTQAAPKVTPKANGSSAPLAFNKDTATVFTNHWYQAEMLAYEDILDALGVDNILKYQGTIEQAHAVVQQWCIDHPAEGKTA